MDKDRIYDFLARLNKDLDEVRGRIIGMKPLSQNKKVFFWSLPRRVSKEGDAWILIFSGKRKNFP